MSLDGVTRIERKALLASKSLIRDTLKKFDLIERLALWVRPLYDQRECFPISRHSSSCGPHGAARLFIQALHGISINCLVDRGWVRRPFPGGLELGQRCGAEGRLLLAAVQPEDPLNERRKPGCVGGENYSTQNPSGRSVYWRT